MSDFFMRFPQGKAKALTLSYDDGVEQDRKLIAVMNRNGIKGTFNLNSGSYAEEGTVYPEGRVHRRLTELQATELYTDSGQEVAVHTFTHPYLDRLPVPLAMQELLKDRERLEEQFHTVVRGMAYPYGIYSDSVVECLKKAGLVYGRTTVSTHGFQIPGDWLRLPATCHHKDPELMSLAQRFVEESPKKDPWLFYLWGHSYEFEGDNNWNVIEEFLEYMGGRGNVWYATNLEIHDYVQAYGRLEFSVSGAYVYNPTAVELFLLKDKRIYSIKPGEQEELR